MYPKLARNALKYTHPVQTDNNSTHRVTVFFSQQPDSFSPPNKFKTDPNTNLLLSPFQRKHLDMVIMGNKKSAAEIQTALMMTCSYSVCVPETLSKPLQCSRHFSPKSDRERGESHLHFTEVCWFSYNTHLAFVISGISVMYSVPWKKSTYGGCAAQIFSTESVLMLRQKSVLS